MLEKKLKSSFRALSVEEEKLDPFSRAEHDPSHHCI